MKEPTDAPTAWTLWRFSGAVMTLPAVTGLTHREAYKDIFCITLIKTLAVFVAISTFYTTSIE